jgi:hypothetical protein
MIRSARFLGAGLLAAAFFACVPGVQTRPPLLMLGSRATVIPAVLTSNSYCSDADSFFQRVAVLTAGYDPNVPPGRYVPPTLQQPPAGAPANNPYNLRKEIVDDLKQAYANAPLFFKTQLCLLDGVYLNSTGCVNGDVSNCIFSGDIFGTSWGFRSRYPAATDNGSRYIAISAGLWQPGQAAWPFHQIADTQLKRLAPWGGAQVQANNPPNPDTSWMTVLAALAHEFGHVRWFDVTVPLRAPPNPPAGGPHNLSPLTGCPNGNFFVGWGYQNDNQLFPKGRWREFNDRKNEGGVIDHASAPFISQFLGGLSADQKNDLFYNLFLVTAQDDPPWASYLGSLVSDEDFVESYVLGVLTGNTGGVYLQSLPVTLVYSDSSTKTVDIPGTLSTRTTLQNKIACIP